jgi:predicted dehydrogenase
MIGGADPVAAAAVGQRVEDMDGTHATTYLRNPRIQLTAGATPDGGQRERFAARTGARTYADWREMIEREPFDLISIATYSPVRAEITEACAAKGIRVIFAEKPVATRLPDAERMLAACRRSGSLLVFNHQRRWNPNHRRLGRAIADGKMGDLVTAHLAWASGRLFVVGTHVIDALLMLTRRRYQAVSATLDLAGKPDCRGAVFHDPGAWAVLRAEGGFMVTVNAADYSKYPSPYWTEIIGTNGRAIVQGLSVTLETPAGVETWPAPADGVTSMDRALTEILGWLDDQTPLPYSADEALHGFETMVGFHASHARNAAWVALPLQGADRDIDIKTA